jgi:ribosomal protein L11 methyltransferase
VTTATTRASSVASATPSADRIIRLTAVVAAADADLAVAECCELTGVGCMQGDPRDGRVQLDIWMPAVDCPGAVALEAHLALAGIAAEVGEEEEGTAWRSALRDFHQPVTAGRIRVRPPWVAPAAGMIDIVIDPGMAFGTGQHPTTRTALELLQEVPAGEAILDAGCGSGVLSIAAARLGLGAITAIDHDPEAVSATARGARANMVAIDVRRMTIGDDRLPAADILLANITLEVLGILASALHAQAAPGEGPRHVVLSGLRVHEVDEAVAAFAPLGVVEQRRLAEDGWASVRLSA